MRTRHRIDRRRIIVAEVAGEIDTCDRSNSRRLHGASSGGSGSSQDCSCISDANDVSTRQHTCEEVVAGCIRRVCCKNAFASINNAIVVDVVDQLHSHTRNAGVSGCECATCVVVVEDPITDLGLRHYPRCSVGNSTQSGCAVCRDCDGGADQSTCCGVDLLNGRSCHIGIAIDVAATLRACAGWQGHSAKDSPGCGVVAGKRSAANTQQDTIGSVIGKVTPVIGACD